MRIHFEQELKTMDSKFLEMHHTVCQMVSYIGEFILNREKKLVHQVEECDNGIQKKGEQLENLCMSLLLRQQPVATDLRRISAMLQLVGELERIAHHTRRLLKFAEKLESQNTQQYVSDLKRMSEEVLRMLATIRLGFLHNDRQVGVQVYEMDNVVDTLFDRVQQKLLSTTTIDIKDNQEIFAVLTVAKYFERMGDRIVNISNWIVFSVEGVHLSR